MKNQLFHEIIDFFFFNFRNSLQAGSSPLVQRADISSRTKKLLKTDDKWLFPYQVSNFPPFLAFSIMKSLTSVHVAKRLKLQLKKNSIRMHWTLLQNTTPHERPPCLESFGQTRGRSGAGLSWLNWQTGNVLQNWCLEQKSETCLCGPHRGCCSLL